MAPVLILFFKDKDFVSLKNAYCRQGFTSNFMTFPKFG